MSTAIAWGRPCHESTGMTHGEFIALLREASTLVKELASLIPQAGGR